MEEQKRQVDFHAALVAAGVVLIIVYGSLYSFGFRPIADPGESLRALLSDWKSLRGPADILANIIFYAPLGFFLARALTGRKRWTRIAVAGAVSLLLSISMEWLQSYVASRVPTMSDVYANTAGGLLGAFAAGFLERLTFPSSAWSRDFFAVLILGSWLGARLYPFVPVVDLHKYWEALKPLILTPRLSAVHLYRHFAVLLAVGVVLEALIGVTRSRVVLPALFSLVLFARILIAGVVLSPAEVVGGCVAVLAWSFWIYQSRVRTGAVTALFVGAVIVSALEPFQFQSTPQAFGWIPFRSFISGSLEVAIQSFFEKLFTYSCLLWLLVRCGLSWTLATVSGAALVLILRLAQVYIPGRSAEITDVCMLIILAGIMRFEARPP